MMERCDLCRKNSKNFPGFVWYPWGYEANLCRSCYSKWTHTKEHRELKKEYKNTKPCTKQWYKLCDEEQKAFDKWFHANGGKMTKTKTLRIEIYKSPWKKNTWCIRTGDIAGSTECSNISKEELFREIENEMNEIDEVKGVKGK